MTDNPFKSPEENNYNDPKKYDPVMFGFILDSIHYLGVGIVVLYTLWVIIGKA